MLIGLLPGLLLAAIPQIVFLVVVGVFSRGRVRTLGMVAGVLALVSVALGVGVVPLLYSELDMPAAQIGVVSSLFNLVGWVGTGLLAAALVIGGRATARPDLPYRQPPTGAAPYPSRLPDAAPGAGPNPQGPYPPGPHPQGPYAGPNPQGNPWTSDPASERDPGRG